jgi:hypothetical protein
MNPRETRPGCRWCANGEKHFRHSNDDDRWMRNVEILVHRALAQHRPGRMCPGCPPPYQEPKT